MSLTPPWMVEAKNRFGTKEVPGTGNNQDILDWAKEVGTTNYTADSIPWCALFIAWVMARNGITPPTDPLWALNWTKFGIKLDKPVYGSILVFRRTGGGHVTLAIGKNPEGTLVYGLGGNQGDQVKIEAFDVSKIVSIRWPEGDDFQKFISPLPVSSTIPKL